MYQQSCASLSLARLMKDQFPAVQIVFGGANCADEMGAALCRAFPFVDYVCTGEGDIAFPMLVEAIANGHDAQDIPGITSRSNGFAYGPGNRPHLVTDLDTLPYPDFNDYFAQLKASQLSLDVQPLIPLETSRGCWWGQRHPCTFCGLLGSERAFRSKSPSRALNEILHFAQTSSDFQIMDCVMDLEYFETLLPELAERSQGLSICWEVRATLKREQIALLAKAGIRYSQPGIESLMDPVLKLMNKGTTCIQNIQTLKWCREFGIEAYWNWLYAIPGEDPTDYASMRNLVPLLFHLTPPTQYRRIRPDRFSAYADDPAAYGITRLETPRAYRCVYHGIGEPDLGQMTYTFHAEYPRWSAIYARELMEFIDEWKTRSDAVLDVFPSPGTIRIVDTRARGEKKEYQFDGLAAKLYLLCDAAHSVTGLMDTLSSQKPPDESAVTAILNRFAELGLMIHRGKQYLSLAVVRNGQS